MFSLKLLEIPVYFSFLSWVVIFGDAAKKSLPYSRSSGFSFM
jgi:hypothetical protein